MKNQNIIGLIFISLFCVDIMTANVNSDDIPEIVLRSFGGLTKQKKIELFGSNGENYEIIYVTPESLKNVQEKPSSVLLAAICERRLTKLVNDKTKTYDYFLCPQDDNVNLKYCCGEEKEQKCCSFVQFIGTFSPVRSDGFVPVASVILMGVVFFGAINVGLIVFLHKKRLRQRKLAKENTIVVYSPYGMVDNMSEVRGSSLISARPPSKPGSVMGRTSGNSVTANWVKSSGNYGGESGRDPYASQGASVLDGNSQISGSARYSNLPPSASREFDNSSGIFSSKASTTATARPGNWSVGTANQIRKSRSRENVGRSRENLDSRSGYAPSLPAPSIAGFSQATGATSLVSAPPRAEYFSTGAKPMGPKGPKKSRRPEESIGEVPEGTLTKWKKSQTDLEVFEDELPQEKLISAKPIGKSPAYAQKPIALSSMRSDGKKTKKEKYIEPAPEDEPELNPSALYTPSIELISADPYLGNNSRSGILSSDASYPSYGGDLDPRAPQNRMNNTHGEKSSNNPKGLISAASRTGAAPKTAQYRPPKIITAYRGKSPSSSSESDIQV